MKKLILIALAGFSVLNGYSQCAFNNTFLLDATPPACPGTMNIGCMNPGEYVTINVVAGNDYTFTTCGGTLFTDTELTLYNGAGTTVLASNDDDCGLQSTINWNATLTGTVNLLLDQFPCASSGACVDVEITCTPPVQSGNGCNTDITICTPGIAGPFGFNTPGPPVSSCLDFFGPNYAYIVLYITSSGPLDLLIDGDATTGFLDVAIFDIPASTDPCVAIQNTGNEIGCNYADFSNGCNQFGTTFPCTSSVPAPNVVAGDVVMIVVENWSGSSSSFTMDLANPPSAQTGPPDPTINPVAVLCSTDPAFQMTAVNMGGDWSGTGVSPTGTFNPATAGVGTHTINYVIGQPPCQASSSIDVQVIDCSAPCDITNLTANVGACVVGPNTYSTSGQVTFVNAPAAGQLIVEDCNGVQQIFNPPFVSPANYNLTGQTANGAACDITAYFTSDPACTQSVNYTAPVCLCNIDNFVANIGACLSNNTFEVTGTVTYSSPPAGGTMTVIVNNSGTNYTQTFNPPFTSPDNFTITGIPSNGAAITITVVFSANPGCTSVINSTAPPSCACGVDIGTFNASITGSSTNNYVLCYGDQIDINSNNDFDAPDEMFAPPGPPYDPGVSWLIYSCPPTVALVPNLVTDIPDDPCFLGLVSDFNLSDLNDMGMINAFPPGTFTNNTIYYVPITMYSMSSGTYSYVNTTMPCYELGTPYAVQYLPQFNAVSVQDCNTGTATITVSGGLPAVNGSNFTASNLLPVTANFTSTTAPNNGSFVINNLTGGQMWSFTVNDGNGCPYTVNGGPFPPTQNPSFSYPSAALCVTGASMNPVITGVPGGTFTSSPAGLTLNAATGQINPTTSTIGTYNVTYTTPGPCPDDMTVVVDIITAPVANAGPDVSICPGTSITLNGSGLGTPSWAPGGTLSATNILNPVATPAATTTYTLTLNASGCIDSDDVTVTILNPSPIAVSPDVSICEGDCTTLTVAGGDFFVWDPNIGIVDSSLTTQNVCPTVTTTYTVTSYTEGSNLITNGDFSSGNTGFNSSYTFTNPTNTAEAQYNVISNPQTYNGGFSACGDHTGGGNMMVVNGSSVVGATVWCQTIPISANTDYLFSAWLASVFPTNPAVLQFTINGTPVGSNLNASGTTCVWNEFFTTWNSGLATSATICITNLNTNIMGNDFAIDDISFTPVCEQTESITVTVNPVPVVDAGPDQTLCDGDVTVLNGSGATTYAWDNGVTDGVSFTPAATTTYTVTGTGTGGCQSTDQATITVNPIPVVNAGPDQTICVGDPVTLAGTGAGVGGVYAWDNGVVDGVAFNPAATNTYTVTGTNSGLCSNTDQVTVTVNPLDDPSFVYPSGLTYCQTSTDPTANVTGLAGGTFSFAVVSGGPFLDINTATGFIDLSTSDLGTYAITYNTSGAPGSLCPQTSSLNLTITDAPVADFTFATYCLNDIDPSPTFINGGSGGIFSFVPGGLSINVATGLVDLSASTPGTYTVTNTINIAGCALATYDDDIVINGLPDANISGTTTICPGDPLPDITINLTAGVPNWDLTYNFNGTPSTVNAPASPYVISGAAIGTYSLVSVTDGNGCTNTIAGNATINTYQVPVMNALNDQEVCEGLNLSVQGFTADIAGSTFDWVNTTGIDVGFGLSGNGMIPIFLAQNGTGTDISVTVSVTPTSPNGCVGLPATFIITVHANPIVSFSADTLTGCEPFEVNFTNTSSVAGQNCVWNFGPGLTAVGCGTVPMVFSAGSYDVSLSVTTTDGCFGTATVNNYITVFETPEAAFSYSPQILDIGNTEVEFTNLSSQADLYEWDFGDTTPINLQINPSHIYPEVPNQYLVTLIASNNNGLCADTAQQLVIIQDVLIFYVPNVFTPDHDEFNEGFHPVFTSGYDPFDYHLTIFNRWGEIVFESYNSQIGWDGTYSNQGLVQDGVYVWQIEFKETMSDKRHTYRGHVTVLK